jgi:hypothetical protein
LIAAVCTLSVGLTVITYMILRVPYLTDLLRRRRSE